MKRKKGLIALVTVLVLVILAFAGYNIYRYPAMFRSLKDNSLNEAQTLELREEILSRSGNKVLVAYFSYSGTTRNIANAISEKTGGDLFEITPQNGYSNVYRESNREIRSNERPALTDTVENMEEYDVVFVGYPVWWHATPAPVNTFLESYDLTGKLIIPFCTSGGSDIDETMPTFLHSCDGLAVYGERRISGTGQIDGWLSEIGLTGLNGNAAVPGEETPVEPSEPETAISGAMEEAAGGSGGDSKTLIVYFSWSAAGNTAKMASYIQEQTGGDLLKIEPLNPYPDDYEECTEAALAERDENARPEIANLPDSIGEYDTILIGYLI